MCARGVDVAHKLAQAEVGVEGFSARVALFVGAQVGERDGDAGVEECQFAHTIGKNVVTVFRHGKDGLIGPEMLARAAQVGFAHHGNRGLRMTLGIFLTVNLAVAEHLRHHFLGKGVDAAHAHAVQAAGDFVRAFVELTAGMEHSHHHFQGGAVLFGVHVYGNAATIVLDDNGIVFANGYFDVRTVAGERFVNGVVHRFVYEVMQTLFADVADVHGRAFTHGFKSFEHLNVTRAVTAACLFYFFHLFIV